MEYAVEQQPLQFARNWMRRLGRLARRRRHRDDHVAERARPAGGRRRALGKGENVRGAVLAHVLAVQVPDLVVVTEDEGKLAPRRSALGVKQFPNKLPRPA